ncbi:MAG: hypothetical protein JST93_34450 [Acidobacteria bacterium]|nr:hypothetical protein [Acidobacteriota bacterium]
MDSLLLLYFAVFGGGGRDFPQSIAVNGAGHAIVAGTSASDNFPTSAGAAQAKPKTRAWTPFLAEMSADGSDRVFATYLGGSAHSYGSAVAAGRDGSVCLAGATSAADFPVTAGSAQTKFGGTGGRRGAGDAYVAKFDSSGRLVYASFFGGTSDEGATAVAMTTAGECVAAGFTTSGNLPTTHKSAYEKRPAGKLSGFLAVFSSDGKQVTYATYLPHDVSAMQMTAGGICFVAGKEWVSKIGCKGKRVQWSVAAGGGEGEWTRALALDGTDHLRVVREAGPGKGAIARMRVKDGQVEGTMPYGENGFTSVQAVAADGERLWIAGSSGQPERAFVAVFDAHGKELMRHDAGDKGEERVRALAMGPGGTVFAAGEAAEDVFVWKLRVNSASGRTAIQTQTTTLATNRH